MRARLKYMLIGTALATTLLAWPASQAAALEVVASIKPVHSLVAGVMKGVGTPALLMKGASSPHTFSLKPSDARMLERAQVIFWVGEALAPVLERPFEVLPKRAKVLALAEVKGIEFRKLREGGLWEEHEDDHGDEKKAHGDHDHKTERHHGEEKEHHKADEHHEEEKEKRKAGEHHGEEKDHHHKAERHHDEGKEGHHKEEAHGHGHGHDHADVDAHIWLSPVNARKMVDVIARTLEEADPGNAKKYAANARSLKARINRLDEELRRTLAPVRGMPYIVFHDAYQYMEARYGLTPIGSVTLSPEKSPGAARLVEIRKKIRSTKSICVFAEPQFNSRMVETIVSGTRAGIGVLDPLGADVPAGEDAYFVLMRAMAKSLTDCLGRKA